MLFKLAIRNMRRSVKDYAIYFVTLIIAVIIFYAFNSITDQQIMRDIEESGKLDIIFVMNMTMNTFSVVVALVLGFLIIYANQLLVKRRKMEFGIYFTLGMKPIQVSRILLYETVLVGLVSLALGLVLGILASQLLSFASAALFDISMSEYHFEFSTHAFGMTLIAFCAIYVVVGIFNVIVIHRCKLIDLINASKQNQKVAIRNPWLCLVLFVASLGILAFAYWRLIDSGFISMTDNLDFIISTVLMLAGTFLFFFSLAGFMVAVITRSKRFYFRRLRPFTLRQVASKINTSFVSMWVVCVLLFLSITTFSTGMNLVNLFTGDLEEANPYDASLIISGGDQSGASSGKNGDTGSFNIANAQKRLESDVKGWDESVEKSIQIDTYSMPDTTYESFLDKTELAIDNDEMRHFADSHVEVMPISQLNASLEMIGEQPIGLSDNEYAVLNNMPFLERLADKVVKDNVAFEIGNVSLDPSGEVEKIQIHDFTMLSTPMMIAVPDRAIIQEFSFEGIPEMAVVNIMFKSDANIDELFKAIDKLDVRGMRAGNIISREEMFSQAKGLRVMLTYLAVYIGLVLLIATAAVLAIQLLSLAIDSIGRYKMLVKLGCESSMIKGSLFAQVVIFFCVPLMLAACHCICAISVINGELSTVIKVGTMTTGIYVALLLAIYVGYMVVTYLASKSTIKDAWVRA